MLSLLVPIVMAAEGPAPSILHHDPVGVGVGVVLGLPTGLSLAYKRPSNPFWFDLTVAWSFDHGGGFMVQGDALWTVKELNTPEWEDIHFPVYFGIGPRFFVNEGGSANNSGHDNYLGARIPFGMSVYHTDVPLEGFLELAPIIKVFPEIGFALDAVVGARFYFGKGTTKMEG